MKHESWIKNDHSNKDGSENVLTSLGISQCVGLAHEFDVKVQTAPMSVETVNAGLGVAVAGILFFTFGIVTWVVTHI